jgi:uncharacterized membrane protein YhhN
MLRYGLLGGSLGPLPWQIFITLGGAFLAAGLIFAVLFPLWSTYAWAGALEMGVSLVVGAVLLAVGWARRSRELKRAKAVGLH